MSAEGAHWWTIPDIVAATILAGRVPGTIERAIIFRPVGRQQGLRATRLRGEIKVDPRRQDLFKIAVQERERHKALGSEEAERMQGFLKTFGNASGYGLHVEVRRRDLRSRGRHRHHQPQWRAGRVGCRDDRAEPRRHFVGHVGG